MRKYEKKPTPHLTSKSIINTIFADQTFYKQQKMNVYLLMIIFLLESLFLLIWDLLCEFLWVDDLYCENGTIVKVFFIDLS